MDQNPLPRTEPMEGKLTVDISSRHGRLTQWLSSPTFFVHRASIHYSGFRYISEEFCTHPKASMKRTMTIDMDSAVESLGRGSVHYPAGTKVFAPTAPSIVALLLGFGIPV